MSRSLRVATGLAASLALFAAACGVGGEDDGGGTAKPGGSSRPAEAQATLQDAQAAVVRIEALGTFADPGDSLTSYEESEGAGSGSGFIISPAGLAITNNHVVKGAASLEVYVEGEDEPVGAKVLGTSECNDLAVIDLEGDDYPYLDWYDGPVKAGLEVRAAGFPLGDPEYTLSSGIVSKAEADGESSFASVESVLEHDASLQPGNSGGPLLDAETGAVVAVNYSSMDPGSGTRQSFAIGADLAEEAAEDLQEGDVLSLGINGEAVVDEESGIQGIWVSSVDTNSPAGELGLRGGDIVERIEGLSVGYDGTLEDYCDILRSHDAGDKLSVQVLRFEDDVRLEGEFNGDELTEKESLGTQIEEQTGELETGDSSYTDYIEVTDDTGTVSVEVPVEWADLNGVARILDDGTEIPSIIAAPDIATYDEYWDAPGVEVAALGPEVEPDDAALVAELTATAAENCTDAGSEPYEDALYVGVIQYYSSCGSSDSNASVVGISAGPEDGSFTALVYVQLATDADLDALDHIIDTFVISF
jgi:serine protease Do